MGKLDQMPVKIRQYEKYVTNGLDDDDLFDTEALLALLMRDGIEERWGELDEGQREEVYRLDEILASKHEHVAEVLPTPQSREKGSGWWWHLHLGPQVREQALSEG